MSATKHTKGPWKPAPTSSGALYGAIVAEHPVDGAPMVNEARHVEAYGGYLIAESVVKSNQPLIAAAPDLLEALRDLMECPYFIDEATVSKKHGLEGTMQLSPHQVVGTMSVALLKVRAARAAIAKAIGAAPAAKADEDDRVCSECFCRGCNGECGGDDLMGASS